MTGTRERRRLWLAQLTGAAAAELDAHGPHAYPEVLDVLVALVALADGSRRKVLVPVVGAPAELALLRRGSNVLVSYYHTEATPDVMVLDRRVPLVSLLDATADVARDELAHETRDDVRRRLERAIDELDDLIIVDAPDTGASAIKQSGGAIDEPGDKQPIAFGFEAAMFASADAPLREGTRSADVHAMLFGGQLWAWVRGRRVPLVRKGPLLLAVIRMLGVARALAQAWEEERAVHVRLRSGSFLVGVRREKGGEVALSMGSDEDGVVTVPALDVEDVILPILRLTSEILRALVSVDRSQRLNLRISSLRDEVRELRRIVRSRTKNAGFANDRAAAFRRELEESDETPLEVAPPKTSLRFAPRWTAVVDGLDASATFFCGDRLVVCNDRRAVALDRDTGEGLWQIEGEATTSVLADQALVRIAPSGRIELRHLGTGELLLETKVQPRTGAMTALHVSGGSIPSTLIVSEGRDRLVGIDLRTGEPRFRYTARGATSFRAQRAGRLLLVSFGDTHLDALDVVTGEVLWRFAGTRRFTTQVALHRDTVFAVGGEIGRGEATLYAIDLASGTVRFERQLGASVTASPMNLGDRILVPLTGGRRGVIAAFSVVDGTELWQANDPGIGVGAGTLVIDERLVVNAPSGRLHALDARSGETLFTRSLSHPVRDEVPRRLTPILRGAALFVPAAMVQVARTHDGTAVGTPPPCDLVPDVLHVDERGWMYVGEESGHILALAPLPHLSLVRPS